MEGCIAMIRIFLFFIIIFSTTVYAFPKARPSSLMEEAESLTAQKQYQEAAVKYEEALQYETGNINTYIELARILVLSGQRKQALEKLDFAFQLAKRKKDLERLEQQRNLLSEVFYTSETFQNYQNALNQLKLEKIGIAKDAIEQALHTEPDNVAILYAYAQILKAMDEEKLCAETLDKAFHLNPKKTEVRLSLAELMLNKDPSKSLFLVGEIKNYNETSALLYARALYALDQAPDAVVFLRKQQENNPDWVKSLYWLGYFYAEKLDSKWMARKYLMMYLRRDKKENKIGDLDKEAEELLSRINQDLELGSS